MNGLIVLVILLLNNLCENKDYCINKIGFDARECPSIKKNRSKSNNLSKLTCFKQRVNFTMGTNTPIFKLDGEGPTRLVVLEPFCIDQTEVSNLQFSQFVEKTGYVTEVLKANFYFLFSFMDFFFQTGREAW
jgi:hypothetical protein